MPDHRLRGWPHNQLLLQPRLWIGFNAVAVLGAPQPVMGHNGAFLCEALDVLSFFG